MRTRLLPALLMSGALGACSTPGGPYPSLQPRPAEAIDPRVPVERPMNDRLVSPALAGRLAELVGEARAGEAAFDRAADQAERLAASAGGSQSEGWVAAQEALSAAAAARGPTTTALGDIDALGGNALQTHGGISPNDLAAIEGAGAQVGAIDRRQAQRIKAIQARLGR
ncbi:MAG: hypothetical protein ABI770_00520 [Sphingomicrobium sp.]